MLEELGRVAKDLNVSRRRLSRLSSDKRSINTTSHNARGGLSRRPSPRPLPAPCRSGPDPAPCRDAGAQKRADALFSPNTNFTRMRDDALCDFGTHLIAGAVACAAKSG